MLLQHIKLYDNIDETLFVTADDLYFAEHKLIDLAMDFYQHGGKKLYIDEIHKYAGWAREIKNIYDLIPRLQVVYTGSSILDLEVTVDRLNDGNHFVVEQGLSVGDTLITEGVGQLKEGMNVTPKTTKP